MRKLEGLTIVLMGATGGMGTATALQLARPGVKIAFSSSRPEKVEALREKLASTGAEIFGAVVDVTEEAQVQRFIQEAKERFGRVDVLVNFYRPVHHKEAGGLFRGGLSNSDGCERQGLGIFDQSFRRAGRS